MAVDYGMLSRIPSVGARFAAGQEAGRAAAAQNMLLQQRQMEFQQAQEDRRLAMEERRMQREAAAAQVARRGQLAQVLRQSGMDPSDMQSATQFYAAALEANEPTAIAAAKDWLSIARETAQSRAAGAEYQGIMGGAPAPAPMAAAAPVATPMAAPVAAPAPIAAAVPQELSALAVEQAAQPRPEFYGQGTFAGTAPTAVTSPIGEFPAAPPPANMLAPQTAAPVNAMLAPPTAAAPAPAAAPTPAPAKDDAAALRAEAQRLEAQQQRLRQSGFKANQERAKELDKPIERLLKRADDIEKADADKPPLIVGGRLVSRTGQIIYEPPPGPIKPSERYVPVGQNVFDRVEGKFIEGPARVAVRAETEARVKPAAPIRVRPGEVVISPETGQPIFTAPPAPARAPAGRAAAAAAGAPAAGTPAQQAKAEAQQAAQTNLSRDLQTQLGYYEELAKMGAMSSPGRPVVANVLAYARSSGLGQEAERAAGTKAQTLRDNIANARQRILMHVKNATGATAGQMNSNIELQTWLRSLTDPQQSIETVRETLKQMDAVIGSVRNQVAQEGTRRAPVAAPAAAPSRSTGVDIQTERTNAQAAIAAGAPEAAVRQRFKDKTGQEL